MTCADLPVTRMQRPRRLGKWLLLLSCSWALPGLAIAQQAPPAQAPAKSDSIWDRDKLLGDPGGLRSWLENRGIELTLQETSEVLGNVTGGVHQGATYEGATLMGVSADTGKLLGLRGGTFNASAYQIHGQGLSAENLDNLAALIVGFGAYGDDATRLGARGYDLHHFCGDRELISRTGRTGPRDFNA